MDRVPLTPCGYARLLARIEEVRRAYKAVCDDNPAALESGDTSGWHDNFAFEENQRQMHQLARRVVELESVLGRIQLVGPLEHTPERVVVGANVTWQVDDEEPRTAWIAGWEDGDPGAGRLSVESPLARALLGARVGDAVQIQLGGRLREVTVVALGPTP